MKTIIMYLAQLAIKAIFKIFFRFSVDNIGAVGPRSPALLVINSVSFVDALIVQAALPRMALFLINKHDFDRTHLKPMLILCGAMGVDFENALDKKAAYEKAGRALSRDGLVAFFPEGSITRSGFLNAFDDCHTGLAKQFQCPVIPLYIDFMRGSRNRVFGKSSVTFGEGWRRRATVVCGNPVDCRTRPNELRKTIEALSVRAYELRKRNRRSLGYMMVRCARSGWFRESMMDTFGKRYTAGTMLIASIILKKIVKTRFNNESSIGVLLPASTGGALVNVGIALAGKVPVNLNFTTSSENIAAAITACSIKTVITSKLVMKKMQHLTLPGNTVFVEDLIASVSGLDRLTALLKAVLVPARVLAGERNIHPDDCATIVFSSGSTSNPKGIVLTHHNIISNIEQMHTVFDFSIDDCMCGVLPFFHSFGFTVTLWFPLVAGFRVAYHPNPLDGSIIAKLVREQKATILPCTPTFLQTYMRKAGAEDFTTLRLIISGAEKLRPAVARAFEEKFNVAPLEGYGATEMSPVAALNVPDADLWGKREQGTRPGTIGRLLPGMSARIVDPDTGRALDEGATGLLLLKGPNIMKGYLGMPEKTAEAIVDGWYRTGDVAAISADGFITLTDRLTRFSKIGGEMVPHGALEEVFRSALENGDAVAVTAVPDRLRGEKLAVLYTESAGMPGDLMEVLEKANVPNLWKPSRDAYVKVPAVPVLGTGKTDLKAIRAIACAALIYDEQDGKI